MRFCNKEIGLIIPPKKQNTNNKTIKVKSLNGYGATGENIDSENTLSVKSPVEQPTKPKPKVSIGLSLK